MRGAGHTMKKYYLFLFIALLSLAACGEKNMDTPNVDTPNEVVPDQPDVDEENEPVEETMDMADFFMPDGSVVEFEGEGNEFASYTQKTEWIDDQYVNIYEDNGGTTVLYTFRVAEDQVDVIRREGEMYNEDQSTAKELDELTPLYIYLKLPLEKSARFDDWEVVDVDGTLDTPYDTFKDVITIEKDEGDLLTRLYFAKGYGEIKREIVMEDATMTVTSTIKNVSKK